MNTSVTQHPLAPSEEKREETNKQYKVALTIAGFDGSGGAGIQADLKTYSALGCYGLSVLTALPAQNTTGVRSIFEISPQCIQDQLDVLFTDIDVRVVKVGMLHNREVIESVAAFIEEHPLDHLVVDPVIYAKSGDRLLDEDAIYVLKERIVPLSSVLTPNIPEASALLGVAIQTREDMEAASYQLSALNSGAVVLKGGHLKHTSSPDCLCEAEGVHWLEEKRVDTINNHGTGCTFSAAIAAFLARGESVASSVKKAKEYLFNALQEGAPFRLGKGHGPVHHFYHLWP